jgi:hypothetical protein
MMGATLAVWTTSDGSAWHLFCPVPTLYSPEAAHAFAAVLRPIIATMIAELIALVNIFPVRNLFSVRIALKVL